MDSAPPAPLRILRAIVLAPLAAPLVIMSGTISYNAAEGRPIGEGSNSLTAVLLLGFFLFAFGAPLTYGSTVLILWPVASRLHGAGRLTWWILMIVGGLAGAILFPAYMHLWGPGEWHFFPGAGFAAGAGTGLAFWYVAMGTSRAQQLRLTSRRR